MVTNARNTRISSGLALCLLASGVCSTLQAQIGSEQVIAKWTHGTSSDRCMTDYLGGGSSGGPPAGGSGGEGGGDDDGGQPPKTDGGSPGAAGWNSVDLWDRNLKLKETDFVLYGMHGLDLVVKRVYNAGDHPRWNVGTDDWDIEWDTMFGPKWRGPYDATLYKNINPDLYDSQLCPPSDPPSCDYAIEYVFIDETGDRVFFLATGNPDFFITPKYDGPRALLEVDQISSSPDVFEYLITRSNGSQLVFNDLGRLIKVRQNIWTDTEEEIEIEYDVENRPWKVHAPGDDDRYIRFNYPMGTDPQVESVDFVAGVEVYEDIVTYEYGAAGLERVNYGGANSTFSRVYEHGSFDPLDEENLSTTLAAASIGRLSIIVDGGDPQPVFAYEYVATDPIGFQQAPVAAKYAYDPIGESWEKLASYPDTGTVIYEQSSAMDKPTTYIIYTSLGEIVDISYDNTTSVRPTSFTYRHDDFEEIRAPYAHESLWDTYQLTKEWDFDDSNGDWRLQYRLLAERTFFNDGPTDYMETEYEYDTNFPHLVSRIKNAEGEEIEYAYYSPSATNVHARGRRWTITRNGVVTSFDYHDGSGKSPAGLLAEVTTPFGTTTYEYDERGQVIEITAPNGSVTEFAYNDFGHVIERTTELGTWKHAYSSDEYLTDGTTPVPNGEVYFPPRLLETRDPDDNVTRHTYNGAGKIVETTDPNDITTEFEYDGLLRLTLVRNGEGNEHEFEYDFYGRMIAFSDGRGLTTTYEYDEFGRVVRIEDPEGTERNFTYDAVAGGGGCGCGGGTVDQVTRIEQRDGSFVHYEYDLAGRLLNVEYSGSDTPTSTKQVEFLYDLASRPVSVTDTRLPFSGNEYLFIYDTGNTGLLERVVHPDGHAQDFLYDANLQVKGYFDVDGNIVQYTRDGLGRVTTLRDTYGGNTVLQYATTSDTGFPVGAVMTRTYGNDASEEYLYDPLGRIETINHFNPISSRFDYVTLEYGAAGEILARERKDGSFFYKTLYEYDDAYRLTLEENEDNSSAWKNSTMYIYDSAGNRQWKMFLETVEGDSPVYLYANNSNKLEEIMFPYIVPGGYIWSALFQYDDRGNMTERLLRTDMTEEEYDKWTYGWNEDDRLVSAKLEKLDDEAVVHSEEHKYRYDYVGRRVLSELPDGTLVRHYFNGLTEEVRKVSVTSAPDPSDFDFHVELDGSGTPSGWPSPTAGPLDLVTDYYELDATSEIGTFYTGSGAGIDIQNHRTVAVRLRVEDIGAATPYLYITLETNSGRRLLIYQPSRTVADSVTGSSVAQIGFTGGRAGNFDTDERWVRFERDLQAEVDRLFPGQQLVRVTGIRIQPRSGQTVQLKDIKFSNSITIEHNTLGGGAIGHIVRHRTVAPDTAVFEDKWLHYDQVGSVLSESDKDGQLVAMHYQDAFGVRQADWETGVPGGVRDGWAHNTKELDPGTGLMYMYQRHYVPEYGMFMSRAPYETMDEHEYGFAENNPMLMIDPSGMNPCECARLENEYKKIGGGAGNWNYCAKQCATQCATNAAQGGAGAFMSQCMNVCLGDVKKVGKYMQWSRCMSGCGARPLCTTICARYLY